MTVSGLRVGVFYEFYAVFAPGAFEGGVGLGVSAYEALVLGAGLVGAVVQREEPFVEAYDGSEPLLGVSGHLGAALGALHTFCSG